MGIEPDYIILSENPDASTVVLFLEEHIESGTKESKISNDYIEKSLTQAIEKNFVKDVYIEGEPDGKITVTPIKKDVAEKYRDKINATNRISAKFGNKVNFIGTEYEDLLKGNVFDQEAALRALAAESGAKSQSEINEYLKKNHLGTMEKLYFKRVVFENIFIAMNIRDHIKNRKSKISFEIIGSQHERITQTKTLEITDKGIPHPLPLSSALANNGINVIVVDATKK